MGRYTTIPTDTFDNLQLDAGIILSEFNIQTQTVDRSKIIGATTGGIQINVTPSYSDFGEDVDNCPNNTMELKHLDSWDVNMAFTLLNLTEDAIKMSIGPATVDNSTHKIKPKSSLSTSDFTSELWWVGDRADGGLIAVKLLNALSTSGFALTTTKNGKGQNAVTITGHVSQSTPDDVPCEIYSIEAATGGTK